jgi:hypothetical protein
VGKVSDAAMKVANKVADGLDSVKPEEWDSLTKDTRAFDIINNPRHYTEKGIECWDLIEQQVDDFESYLEGQVFKYLFRYKQKGSPTDCLRKARVYLDKLIGRVAVDKYDF